LELPRSSYIPLAGETWTLSTARHQPGSYHWPPERARDRDLGTLGNLGGFGSSYNNAQR
jgi:hypothetical protein